MERVWNYQISHGVKFLCNVHIFEKVVIQNDEVKGVKVGVTIGYSVNGSVCKDKTWTYEVWKSDNFSLLIKDFYVPTEVQHKGVGHFIWHKFYEILSLHYPSKVVVSGDLSSVDEKNNNPKYRNQLWRDLIGFGRVEGAIFELNEDPNIDGYFKGLIQDPWNPQLSKLDIVLIQ